MADINHPSGGVPCDEAGTFEHSLAELETIVHELEEGQIGLAEALARYEQGVGHFKHCYQLLQQAERKIELLTAVTQEGTAVIQPFVIQASGLEDAAPPPRPRRSARRGAQADMDDLP